MKFVDRGTGAGTPEPDGDAAGCAGIPEPGLSQQPTIDSIDTYARASLRLVGKPTVERAQWNTVATADAIRQFAWGISDDNPLWVDPEYAAAGPYGRLVAPPSFLFSVLYPFLHGVPTSFPLNFLVSGLDCRWYRPILENDRLTATSMHKDVIEGPDRAGRATVYILAETTYRNQADEVVGTIEGTIAATDKPSTEMLLDRDVHSYTPEQIEALGAAMLAERRTGHRQRAGLSIRPGDELPPIVRGPLTLGDLINWQAAIGPSYRAAALAYRDLLANPHTATTLPRVGWPVRYSQQHEDFTLAVQRGMPAPFDNSAMRAAWLSVLLTNWMGDEAFLKRIQVSTIRPVIYGDVNWYAGRVSGKLDANEETLVAIRLTGTNQLGELTTTGHAEVAIPRRPVGSRRRTESLRQHPMFVWGVRKQRMAPVTACDLFDTQVRARPGVTAIYAGTRAVTYAELDVEANQLSHALAARGIRRGNKLGIRLARTTDLAVSILGAVKAGAAYVPLDPSSPPERIAHMLDAAAVDYVLTDEDQSVPERAPHPTIVRLATCWSSRHALPGDRPAVNPAADDAAYVLFTSGSTGLSKAVTVSHGALGLYLCALIDALAVSSADASLHTASFAFSAAVRQYWLPLCTGAKLVLADEEARHQPLLLFAQMRHAGVTVWDTVPSTLHFAIECLRELDEATRAALLDNQLRRIFTTGEALRWDTVRAWRTLAGNRSSIVNLYSQTETTGTVCIHPLPDEDHAEAGIVPLGRPVGNTGICLLDEELQPVADGEVGEICVAGDRLASGYTGRPDLEAKKFVRIALKDGTEQRIFRTGDLGRKNASGLLECLGRVDDQVKIRGLRLRLGEVEAAIRRDRRVGDCIVLASEDLVHADGVRLVAYVVPAVGAEIQVTELRASLANSLPDYARPQGIVLLRKFPRNPNGKVDRSALPPPGPDALAQLAEPVAPRDELEEMIATIWRELLGIEEVGIHDNFFALGGHSLLATRVLMHLRHRSGIELRLRDFFDDATIAGLARLCSPMIDSADSSDRVAMKAGIPSAVQRRRPHGGSLP